MDKGKEHFDGIEDSYENMIIKIVPSSEDFFGAVLSFIPEGNTKILELGSGTGFLTTRIVELNPSAEITCIDLSEGMLDVARGKPELSDVKFIKGDFREAWGDGKFDVILSTLCLHHLPDDDRTDILGKIYDSLNPRGAFINGDVFLGETEEEEARILSWWHKAMLQNNMSEKEADSMIKKRDANHDYLDKISAFTEKMNSTGYDDVMLVYKNRLYGVFVGLKK
ncbi:class I SAM-dependent methyltransferase [Methanococcus maripaludis]|uniref:tRNA (Cmo5U34)-methyltransferase n=2 Tax=Methanococcus maripaludis TaxID=39152 RepID=A0A7J9PI99_METMI|nr:class I SAM-dependent methyltransferase [Methanococcus maripaludis]MBA2862468.1 tRNA (cmo5U34)-methyltransferase [Methanococcus maripaludis]